MISFFFFSLVFKRMSLIVMLKIEMFSHKSEDIQCLKEHFVFVFVSEVARLCLGRLLRYASVKYQFCLTLKCIEFDLL